MADFPDTPPAADSPQPRPGAEIAPSLERVLQNLNVNLEDELTRYRRQRHGRVPPPPRPRRTGHRLDLISVPATAAEDTVTDASVAPALGQPPAPPNPFLNQFEEPHEEPQVDMAPSLLADGGTDQPVALPNDPDSATADASLPIPATDVPTDGYLESSEELLKSIAEERTDTDAVPKPYSPKQKNHSLLKLAGLVLVLLAGIGAGFAVTYPSQLQNLRSQLWPEDPSSSTEPSSEESAADTTTPSTAATPSPDAANTEPTADGYEPPGPDLSTREFVELDLESLSTLDVNETAAGSGPLSTIPNNPAQSPLPQPATTQQPAPAADNQSASPAAAASPEPASIPQPAGTTPQPAGTPQPANTSPSTPEASQPATGSNFYVVASYTGDASLAKARELVPDAFVRNFKAGARIQLAAFDNKAQAEDQVAFLTQQGVTVELFGPTNE